MSNIKKGKERRKFNNNFYMFFLFIFNWLVLDNTNSEKIFTALDRLFSISTDVHGRVVVSDWRRE
jgi:hypothetical protein